MCGFGGILTVQGSSFDWLKLAVTRMAKAIAHRGPDDAATWVDAQAGVALGFQRLAIVDLSSAGHQPMVSSGKRFVIAFNGEIYNHLEIRAELEAANGAPHWRGHSDTETLLAAFEHWGVMPTLARTVGMFAIALWDSHERALHLARDRFGEKPLYYGWVGSGEGRAFVFGSELKALRTYPGFANLVSRQALAQYMRFMVVPAPHSIYQEIYKLEPGCLLSITGVVPEEAPCQPMRPAEHYGALSLQRWWSLADVVQAAADNPVTDEAEAITTLEQRLADAVRLQTLADVPLGAFLSGGVDSSTIVALMQKQSMRPVKTFTVGFEEAEFDESLHARAVAKHLGTEHAELLVTAASAQAVIDQLADIYDEPFADSSQIPTYLVCRAAREHVTVALSGDAGDELFGGYSRYFWGGRIWAKLAWMPYQVRHALGKAISALPIAAWDSLSSPVNAFLPRAKGIAHAGDKAHKLASRLNGVRNIDDLYLSLVSEWQDPALVVRGHDGGLIVEGPSILDDASPTNVVAVADSPLHMMYRDSMTYLPDDILCKVDRAAMAVSLETRVPFLDHRVAELAWQLPLGMKIRGAQGKWALREVLHKYVPRELIDRPKMGFGIPLGQWLIGPLRPWAESLLAEQRLQSEGYFYSAPIRRKWTEHLAGERDHSSSLWAVLMFQHWLSRKND